jgi:hypothetical protein
MDGNVKQRIYKTSEEYPLSLLALRYCVRSLPLDLHVSLHLAVDFKTSIRSFANGQGCVAQALIII